MIDDEPVVTEIVDPVDRLIAALASLEACVRDSGAETQRALGHVVAMLYRPPEPQGPATFDIPFTHQLRVFVHYIVLTATAACTITLRAGRVTRSYVFAGADSRTYPLRIVLDRGINVTLETTAGTVTGYVVGMYE